MLLKEDPGLPWARIIVGMIVVTILAGFAIQWYVGIENEKQAEALYAQARDRFHNEDLDASLILIEQALKHKEKPGYLAVKLNVLMNQNKIYEAEQVVNKLITYEPKNAHFRHLAGLLAYNQEDFPKAERIYREVISVEPDNPEYKVRLANILYEEEKLGEARSIYEALLKRDPNYKYAWEQYITIFSNGERYKEAEAIARKAVERFPSDSDLYFMLANIYDHQEKKAAAVAAYRKSLELEPMKDSIAAERIYELTGKHVPQALEKMDSEQIPFESEDKLMFVSSQVNGYNGRFLVDTGASISIIYSSQAEKYHISPSGSKIEAETANGVVQAPVGYGSVQLGRHTVRPVLFAILPDPQKMQADGIIGMNVMEEFRMEIDKGSQKLTLTH